ncbi:hypothetical protein [Pseudonocardia humida]|uniref:GerMN domain-containing protein n=1 Tax=Pseudonocardia humida TaxID=2800819 RepID=A0ABT0ZXL9_9PSEU|nr:hypothetical protein [Pseudonocardia humida]MCO1655476.1 hypothetical protein [Pseudonocardia humida]
MGVLRLVVAWLIALVAVVIGFPFLAAFLLGGTTTPVDECSTPRAAPRTPDHGAADRLQAALRGLPGVTGTEVEFHPAVWSGQVDGVGLRVAFAADAGHDQVLAAVAPAVDGLRGPEFAGLDARLAFAIGPDVPSSDEAAGFHVLGSQPTTAVLSYARGWLDLRARHPAAEVQVCRDDGAGIGTVARVSVVPDGDAGEDAALRAAFADLEALTLSGGGWARMSVRTTGASGRAGPPTEVEYAFAEAYLDEELIDPMVSAVRRPAAMAPTDELRAVVTWYPSRGHASYLLDVEVVLGVGELRQAPASDPPGRVQEVAAALQAQVEATDLPYELTVDLGDVRVLEEGSFSSGF